MQKDIQIHIQEYIDTYSVRGLQKKLNIGAESLYRVLNCKEDTKIMKKTLNKLYKFFSLEKDDFYKKHAIKTQMHTNVIGCFFREKREELGLSPREAAKRIKGEQRQLTRFETGDVTYMRNSYYMRSLIDLYGFSEEEKLWIYNYIDSMNELRRILHKKSYHRTQKEIVSKKNNTNMSSYERTKSSTTPQSRMKQTSTGQRNLPFWE